MALKSQSPEPLMTPKELPSWDHEVIVSLEEVHFSVGPLDTAPRGHEIIKYQRTPTYTHLRDRVQCASIVIVTQQETSARSLGEAPYLKCIVTPTAGTNHIDLKECERRGIKVLNCAGSTSPAAAEHALSLYFAARRNIVRMHNMIRTKSKAVGNMNMWELTGNASGMMEMANKQPPFSLDEEVVGIIGHGRIGKRLETLCKALGMQVLIAERRAGAPITSIPSKHIAWKAPDEVTAQTPFDEVIRAATVFFVCCVSNGETENLIGAAEFSAMRPEAIIVNVSRAAIVNTKELIKALREHRISGAATDVFDREPASTDRHSAFLTEDTKDLNLTFSPHVGYYSSRTPHIQREMVRERIRAFVFGDFGRFEV